VKIAVVSENGKTVSQHFGRATQYVILNADGKKILSRESRPKVSHADLISAENPEHGCGCQACGRGGRAYDRHRSMVLKILDCSVLLAGGMGWGVYEGLTSRGIKTVITDVEDIEQAVRLYLWENLPNLTERLH
jgi:predicted Fe-Mo cluster-binding NifX family protein